MKLASEHLIVCTHRYKIFVHVNVHYKNHSPGNYTMAECIHEIN